MNSSDIHCRETLTEDDVEAIHVMVANSGVFSAEEIEVAVELAEDRLSNREASDYHFLLADVNGQLAGYTCFGRIPLTDGSYDLYWIVVDGNVQQRGIAGRLLMETEEAITGMQGRMVYAETSSRPVYGPAHGFYRKNGFELVGKLKDFYANGDDKLIFGKSIRRK